MKAISVQNPWAHYITCGEKTIECRSWNTEYRGDLLICSSSNPKIPGMISGYAVCIVSLDNVTQFRKSHLKEACMDEMPAPNSYAWHLSNVRLIKPFHVKGKLNFYNVDDNHIQMFVGESGELTDEERVTVLAEHYAPLAYKFNQIGQYFKDPNSDTVIRWRVGQNELEYYSPGAAGWLLTDESSAYERAFYEGDGDCLMEMTPTAAHKLLETWGYTKPYGE